MTELSPDDYRAINQIKALQKTGLITRGSLRKDTHKATSCGVWNIAGERSLYQVLHDTHLFRNIAATEANTLLQDIVQSRR